MTLLTCYRTHIKTWVIVLGKHDSIYCTYLYFKTPDRNGGSSQYEYVKIVGSGNSWSRPSQMDHVQLLHFTAIYHNLLM